MKERKYQIHEFEPVFDAESRILILGTFPSVKSRETAFYYGHPQNRFWKVLAYLTTEPMPQTVAEKKALLFRHHIALWDVIASCEISGSSDNSIQNVVPVNLDKVLNQCSIKKIFANGKLAGKFYRQYLEPMTQMEIHVLPSTSPANAMYDFERLLTQWQIMKVFLD